VVEEDLSKVVVWWSEIRERADEIDGTTIFESDL
jgi:hypothetical protein